MLMKNVIGQEGAKAGFFRFYDAQRLPHAILVAGKEGTGGLAFALAITQFLLCSDKQGHEACGVCPACQKVQKLAHPDVHFSFPTIAPKPGAKASSKYYMKEFRDAIHENRYITTYDWLQYINAENKQGNITAEECREIADELQLKAFEGGYKIQIIWRPEYLGKEGNILLKLIEEPPTDTILILVAENLEDILNTILSRTQQINLVPLQIQEIQQGLISDYQLTPPIALQIAQISNGNYANAIKLIHHTSSDVLSLMKDWFNGIFTNNGVLIHEWVENVAKLGREQQKNFFVYAQQLIAQAMRYQNIPNYQAPLLPEEQVFAQKIASRNFSLNTFEAIDKALTEACYHIERNVHGKTQLLYTSIQMQYLIKGNELKALI